MQPTSLHEEQQHSLPHSEQPASPHREQPTSSASQRAAISSASQGTTNITTSRGMSQRAANSSPTKTYAELIPPSCRPNEPLAQRGPAAELIPPSCRPNDPLAQRGPTAELIPPSYRPNELLAKRGPAAELIPPSCRPNEPLAQLSQHNATSVSKSVHRHRYSSYPGKRSDSERCVKLGLNSNEKHVTFR